MGGHKSSSPGLDLEFQDNKGTHYLVAIKSGPNWGNSSQLAALTDNFRVAVVRLKQSRQVRDVQPVLGICYGKTRTAYMLKNYLKVVGQNFWALISGDLNLYKEIIEPVGYQAQTHNNTYALERGRIENVLTRSFLDNYCREDGSIDWEKLVEGNSGNYDLDDKLGLELGSKLG